jgi:hypothetical protein
MGLGHIFSGIKDISGGKMGGGDIPHLKSEMRGTRRLAAVLATPLF